MKVPMSWIRQYTDVPVSAQAFQDAMIMRRAYSSAGMSIFVYSFSHFIDTFIVYALLNP